MQRGCRRLVLLFSQLGDFDSLEYAQALVPALPSLDRAGIRLLAIGIGDSAGAERFATFTGFPHDRLQVESDAQLHRACGLYEGLATGAGAWPDLLLMCAGFGSPGTLARCSVVTAVIARQRSGLTATVPARGEMDSRDLSSWPRCG